MKIAKRKIKMDLLKHEKSWLLSPYKYLPMQHTKQFIDGEVEDSHYK
jgi:hypothetical protein